MRWPIFCLTRSKSFAAPPTTKSMRESLVALWNLSRSFFGFGDRVSKSTALGGVNALVQCKEGQVFAVRTVTLVRDGFSTNFSTFLLKSFDRNSCRSSNEGQFFGSKKEKLFPFAAAGSPFSSKSFSPRFF